MSLPTSPKLARRPGKEELKIAFERAYHHLNLAWNARHETTAAFREMTDEQFNQWSKMPHDIMEYEVASSAD